MMHKEMKAWRWKNWKKFLATGRRDALMMQEVAYDENRSTKAREAVKGQEEDCASLRALLSHQRSLQSRGKVIHQYGKCIWEGCKGTPDPRPHNVGLPQAARRCTKEAKERASGTMGMAHGEGQAGGREGTRVHGGSGAADLGQTVT